MPLQAHYAGRIHNPVCRDVHVECLHVAVRRDDDEGNRMVFDKGLYKPRVRVRVETDELNVVTVLVLVDELL